MGVGVQHDHPISHSAGLQGEHSAQLTTAENAEGGARQNHERSGNLKLRMRCSWVRRNSDSRSASSESPTASMAIAKSAALPAPALPMAKVATGTPAGICTMESRERSEERRVGKECRCRGGRGENK